MQKIKWLFGLLLLTQFAFGQAIKEFSKDPYEFREQIGELFARADKDVVANLINGRLGAYLEKDSNQLDFLINGCNVLLQKRMRPEPHYRDFITAYLALEAGASPDNYDTWKSVITGFGRTRSKRGLEEFLEFSALWFNNGILFQNRTLTWSAFPATGILEYDSEPTFRLTDVELTGENKGNATTVFQASGVYYPASSKWEGEKGMINWGKADLNPDENYATFGKHEIKFTSNSIEADSVRLTTQYYNQPIDGRLRDKIIPLDDPNDIKYPYFESFQRDVVLPEILPHIDYKGGFALQGNRFAGMGNPDNPARLVFKHQNKPFIEAASAVFFIQKEKIVSSQAAITVRLKGDSIYHPGLILRYHNDSSLLELIRDERGAMAGPLYSSYHQMDFLPQRSIWHMGDSIMAFGSLAGNAQNEVKFESSNFFTQERMDRLVYANETNPMRLVMEIGYSTGGVFHADEFAQHANWTKENARLLMADLSINGFVFYDTDTRQVIVKQKLYDYVDNYDKRLDYDNIIFLSKMNNPEAPNAVLNVNTRDFEVFGVKMINLSDSQSVAMYPMAKGNRIVIKENRKMLYSGVLKGGGFDFYGDSIQYDYVDHKVDLIKIDSVIMYINKYDSVSKKPIFFPVQTRIENITGELFIDMPQNKAGLDSEFNKEYPILKTNEESFAYYDKAGTFEKVYNREKFYFKIDPFFLDSLDDFNQDALSFPGVLISDGIFPEIRDSLVVQEDYSLGFTHPTPQNGLPMYGGKANFTNDIKLSDKGLVGDGYLEYVTSVSKSDKFYFFPDSTQGIAHNSENMSQEGSPDVPDFQNTFCQLKLYATDDYLWLKSLENPFTMFANEGVKKGELELSPAGLIGRGELSIKNGTLYSHLFKYNHSNAYADTASFDLTTLDGSQVALATPQINAHIDFNYRIGTFKALDPGSLISFPKNRFKAHMDVYKWYLDDNQIELNSSTPPKEGSYASMMVASDPERDSLKFIAPQAIYNIETFEISCENVQEINVADAIIRTGDGKALIKADGDVDTLRNATVIANTDNRFHTLFDAFIVLKTGKSYIGYGKYNYEDDKGNKQEVNFSNIRVDESVQTIADGRVEEEQGFQLNEYFDYRGRVSLKARQKGLYFNGSTRIIHKCNQIDRNWLAFEGQVDPKDVMIPVGTDIKNDLGEPMAAGIMISEGLDSTFLYPSFISQKLNVKDAPITTALGFLWYNGEEKKYVIGSQERHDKTDITGNLLELNTQTCDISANGKLGFGTEFGQVNQTFTGNALFNYKTSKFNMEGTLALDFMMDDKMLTEIANKVLSYPFLKPLAYNTTSYEKCILDNCSPKELESFRKTVKEKGMIETPNCLNKPLVLANVNFVWNRMTESFVSDGDVGLGNITNKNLFVDCRGKVEVANGKRSKDIAVYFELDPQTWFFFKYRLDDKPRMQFQSTVQEVLDIYTTLKDKDRIMNTKKDEPGYTFELGPKSGKATFLDKF